MSEGAVLLMRHQNLSRNAKEMQKKSLTEASHDHSSEGNFEVTQSARQFSQPRPTSHDKGNLRIIREKYKHLGSIFSIFFHVMTLSSLGKYAYDVIWTDTFLDINSNAVVLRRVSKYFDPEHFSVRSVDICLIHVKYQIWQKPKISPSDVIQNSLTAEIRRR